MNANQRWNWIVCLGLLAATAAWFTFSFLPQRRALAELRQEVRQKEEHVLAAAGLTASLTQAQGELDETHAYNRDWRRRSPDQRGLIDLYGRIHDVIRLSGATTTRLEPQAPETLDAISRTQFVLGCSGSYASIHEVLAKLEELNVPLRIESTNIGVLAEDAKNVTCEARVVVFSDNSKDSH